MRKSEVQYRVCHVERRETSHEEQLEPYYVIHPSSEGQKQNVGMMKRESRNDKIEG